MIVGGLLTILSWVLILVGSFLLVVGSLGLVRLPDFYTRLHAAGITDTGGAGFIVFGLIVQSVVQFDSWLAAVKLLLMLLFFLFTGPTATHALARAARLGRLKPLKLEETN